MTEYRKYCLTAEDRIELATMFPCLDFSFEDDYRAEVEELLIREHRKTKVAEHQATLDAQRKEAEDKLVTPAPQLYRCPRTPTLVCPPCDHLDDHEHGNDCLVYCRIHLGIGPCEPVKGE